MSPSPPPQVNLVDFPHLEASRPTGTTSTPPRRPRSKPQPLKMKPTTPSMPQGSLLADRPCPSSWLSRSCISTTTGICLPAPQFSSPVWSLQEVSGPLSPQPSQAAARPSLCLRIPADSTRGVGSVRVIRTGVYLDDHRGGGSQPPATKEKKKEPLSQVQRDLHPLPQNFDLAPG